MDLVQRPEQRDVQQAVQPAVESPVLDAGVVSFREVEVPRERKEQSRDVRRRVAAGVGVVDDHELRVVGGDAQRQPDVSAFAAFPLEAGRSEFLDQRRRVTPQDLDRQVEAVEPRPDLSDLLGVGP